MKKVGRPKSKDITKKGKLVIRILEKEKRVIKKMAKKLGYISTSEYVRKVLKDDVKKNEG